jgi:(N-acetylneuraminyl)-galactosylglucosylceramide N-acetylgalactosaminyltransferase
MDENVRNSFTRDNRCGMPENWLDNVTVIIKTFERPRSLNNLIVSIRKYYPAIKIIVADDSKAPKIRDDVDYHILPFDSGAGKGRNYLVDQVTTKYFVTLDDDFIFTRQTRLERFYEVLENTPVNLIGGVVLDHGEKKRVYHGSLSIEGDILLLKKSVAVDDLEEMPLYDIVLQFFMAETEIVQKVRWHDDMKTVEHEYFFLRGKKRLVISHREDVAIEHYPELDNKRYMRFRNRREFLSILFEENNIRAFETLQSADSDINSRTAALTARESSSLNPKPVGI